MDTSSDGWILGNILFGGVVGLVVDAATQSGMKFPKRVSLALDPKGFETAADRDAWFERRRKLIERQWVNKFLAAPEAVDCDTSSDAAKRKCFEEMAGSDIRAGQEEAMAALKKKYAAAEVGVAIAAKSSPEATKPAGPKSFTNASERDAWYATARNSVTHKFSGPIASQRKKRFALACDKSEKQAASQACKDVDLQLQLLLDAKAKELAKLKQENKSAVIPQKNSTQSAKAEPRKSRAAIERETKIEREWRERIEAVKRQGPYEDCEQASAADMLDCEERAAKIERLQKEMERDLAS